jgi:cytochrome oxidase Cu insertion factor (SCO1/SenC/PrrC family)
LISLRYERLSLALADTRDAHNAERSTNGGRRASRRGITCSGLHLTSDAGEEVSLRSLRGKPVVLYFYPKDDTLVLNRQ